MAGELAAGSEAITVGVQNGELAIFGSRNFSITVSDSAKKMVRDYMLKQAKQAAEAAAKRK
jgi:hypothetical protein